MAFVLATPFGVNMSEEVETKKNSLARTVFSCLLAMRRREETHVVDTLCLPPKKVRQALDVALLGLEEYRQHNKDRWKHEIKRAGLQEFTKARYNPCVFLMSTDVETGDFCDEGEIVVVGDQVTTRSVGRANPVSRHMSRSTFHYKYALFRRRRRHTVWKLRRPEELYEPTLEPTTTTTTTTITQDDDGYDASSEDEYDER